MSSSETLAVLREHKPVLCERFRVVELALFGSTVRDEARPESDIDILVTFDGPADSKRYFGVWFYIEDLLGRPRRPARCDGSIRPELLPYVVNALRGLWRRTSLDDYTDDEVVSEDRHWKRLYVGQTCSTSVERVISYSRPRAWSPGRDGSLGTG